MKSFKAPWKLRSARPPRSQECPEDDQACSLGYPFVDVMGIYDEVDEDIDKLNYFDDAVYMSQAASSTLEYNQVDTTRHEKSATRDVEEGLVTVLPNEGVDLRMVGKESRPHRAAPLARVESFEDRDQDRLGKLKPFGPSLKDTGIDASHGDQGAWDEQELTHGQACHEKHPLLDDENVYAEVMDIEKKSERNIPQVSKYPETVHEDEVLERLSLFLEERESRIKHDGNESPPGSPDQYQHGIQDGSTRLSIGKEEKIVTSHAGFSMSGLLPIDLSYTPVEEELSFVKGRFLNEKKHKDFVCRLLGAIKSGSENTVKVMVEILKTFRYNLCDDPFREKFYTASMLHVALLFKRDNICRLLIKEFPGLVSVKYKSEKFRNQTAFHIAASNGQYDILDLMLQVVNNREGMDEGMTLLNTKADGEYFTHIHPDGALALTAAAYSGHVQMLGKLIEYGAELDKKVYRGNTLLHCIVKQSVEHPNSHIPNLLFEEVWDKCAIWWWRRKQAGENSKQQAPMTSDPASVVGFSFEPENKRKMLQVEAFRNLLSIRNDADQNILSLSVNLHSNLAKGILNIEHIFKQPQTKFGAISWSTYDVTEVTSYGPPDGTTCRYNSGSVLHILAHRAKLVTREENQTYNDLIEEEPIMTLVKMKWATYRFVYILWGVAHLIMMLGLTAVSLHLHKPELNAVNKTLEVEPNYNIIPNATYFTPEIIVEIIERKIHPWYLMFGIIPLVYLVFELIDIWSTGYSSIKSLKTGVSVPSHIAGHMIKQWTVTGNAPYRICSACFSGFVLSWLLLHMYGTDDQDVPLSLAMVFGWLFTLFFTRACRHVCYFSIMMQKMFFEDCLYFMAIYMFFWLAFSTAIHVLLLYGNTPGLQVWNTLYGMLNVVTDAGEKTSGDVSRIPGIAGALLSIYAVVSVILLLNMLIAMMNTSYEAVKNSKTNIWRYQQLSILLLLERRLWWWNWLCEKSQRPAMWSLSQYEEQQEVEPKRIFIEVTRKSCFESDDANRLYTPSSVGV